MDYFRFLATNARWLTVGFLLTLSSAYGQTFFISLFAGEIREEFGLTHGSWGAIYAAGTLASAFAMIWAGVLTDNFRVRILGPIILVALGISALALSVVTSTVFLGVVIFLLRFFGQGMSVQISLVATARWFVATRGRALTITSLGLVLANAIMPMVFVGLMERFEWRHLWVLSALLAIATAVPIFLLLGKERHPSEHAKESAAAGLDGKHWRRGEMLRLPLFWLSVPFILGPPAWGTAILFQQVHLSEVKGWELSQFAALFPIFTISSVSMSFLSGWMVDKYGANRLTGLLLVPYFFAYLVFASTDSLLGGAVAMFIFGLAVGSGSTVPASLFAELFGTRYIGGIKSLTSALMVLGSALGPLITGYFIDLGIDFPDQMWAIAAYFVLAQILMSTGLSSVRSRLFSPSEVNV